MSHICTCTLDMRTMDLFIYWWLLDENYSQINIILRKTKPFFSMILSDGVKWPSHLLLCCVNIGSFYWWLAANRHEASQIMHEWGGQPLHSSVWFSDLIVHCCAQATNPASLVIPLYECISQRLNPWIIPTWEFDNELGSSQRQP